MLHAFLKRPRHKRSFNLAEELKIWLDDFDLVNGFTQPTSAKLHRLSLIEGTGSLLSSNRLVSRLTDKMRYVQAVSLKRSYR